MGYAPEIWGPSTWNTIHLLCYTAPETLSAGEQLRYTAFFKALPYVLPCATCSAHLLKHYEDLPIENAVHTGAALFEWSVHIHNTVNRMLGKPEMSVEDAKSIWKKKLNTVGDSGASMQPDTLFFGSRVYHWVFIILVLFVFALAFYLLRKGLTRKK
jgi:hypothetical protein